MMWQSTDIVEAVAGRAQGSAFDASSVVIDSRKPLERALFVALEGERLDGHDYVKEALARGAAGALVHRVPEGIPRNAPLIVVSDTYKALVDLAVSARQRASAKIIAVTGSVGKTGTKEAIRTALSSAGNVYATQGNLNNHIGLPLSLANLPADARFGVFELGMNHAGELSFLTRILQPEIAVITNVEAVHLEFFSGLEAIADAKAEIIEGMPRDGTLMLNRDNRYYDRLLLKAKEHGLTHIVTFGAHAEAQCRLVDYRLEGMGSRVEAVIRGTPVAYILGAMGRHWAMASLAALGACVAVDADLADAAAALAHFHEPDGRGRMHRLPTGTGFITLIDDCYNASPSSTQAAITKLAEIKQALGGQGRAIAALGDMLELGTGAAELHRGLIDALMRHSIQKAYLAGPLMRHLFDALQHTICGVYADSAAELAQKLAADLKAGDIVLVKGSRGSRMDIVRDAILASFTPSSVKESIHAV